MKLLALKRVAPLKWGTVVAKRLISYFSTYFLHFYRFFILFSQFFHKKCNDGAFLTKEMQKLNEKPIKTCKINGKKQKATTAPRL